MGVYGGEHYGYRPDREIIEMTLNRKIIDEGRMPSLPMHCSI